MMFSWILSPLGRWLSLDGAIAATMGVAWLRGRAVGQTAWETKRRVACEQALQQSMHPVEHLPNLSSVAIDLVFSQVKDLLDDLWWCSVLRVLRSRLPADQGSVAIPVLSRIPPVETGPADAEVSAGSGNIPGLLSTLQNRQLALSIPLCLNHRDHPPNRIGL